MCLGNSVLLDTDKQIVFKYETTIRYWNQNLKKIIKKSMIDFIKSHRDEKIDLIIGKNS